MSQTAELPRPTHWRMLGTGAALLVAGRITAAACGLVQVPIALHHLGPKRFGIWVSLTGLLWTLTALDGGIGFALQNRIGIALAHERWAEASMWARCGRRWLWGVALCAGAVAAPIFIWGDWAAWLGADAPHASETHAAAWVTFATALLCLPASLATRIATTAQQTWITGLWTAVASILGLIAVMSAAAAGGGLVTFIAAASILPLLPHLATSAQLRKTLPWLHTTSDHVEIDSRLFWRESALFFVPQLAASFVGSFVPMLVALFAGPVMAGSYGVLQRLFGLGLQLQTLALQPTWPLYTQAAARGDAATARRVYRTSMAAVIGAAVLVAVLVVPFTERILHVWLHNQVPPMTPVLIWTAATWHLLQGVSQPPAMVLNGTGHMGVAAATSIGCTTVMLALSGWAGGQWGAIGIVGALALPYAIINMPIVLWQAHGALRAMARPPAP